MAAGLAGAFSGAKGLDAEWIQQVNEATKADPYTNSQRDIGETAEGLHTAVLSKLERERRHVAVMDGASGYLA